MKIIVSPSKTQNISYDNRFDSYSPMFCNEADKINSVLKNFDKETLKSIYNSSDQIVNTTYENIQNYSDAELGQAIFSYTGFVYKQLNANELSKEELLFLNKHLLILSAHYGILRPLDSIRSYRLDYNMTIPNINLKDFWSAKINDHIKNETIINLASNEFSSIIKKNMLDIEFKEKKNGKYKVAATYAKMARGNMIKQIAQNKITDTYKLKDLDVLGYCYNNDLSSENNYVFTKN